MNNFSYKHLIALFSIVLFAAFLRFYAISSVPVSLYWDEVASTYNAYSIAQTGRDEYGISHPLLFKSFLDYKTPANIYLTAVAVKLFGLNEFSARFASAFFGTLTVLLTYFLVLEILNKQERGIFGKNETKKYTALLTSFLLAISPWHLQFSRVNFEANVGLFFVLLGIFLILKFINSKRDLFLFLSMFTLAISIYFYRSIWFFVPFITVSVFFIHRALITEKLKTFIIGGIIFSIIFLPFLPSVLSEEGWVRQKQTNFISNAFKEVYESAVKIHESGNTTISRIIYNRRIVYANLFLKNYISHFLPNFLFLEGDTNPRHRVKGMGVMYHWELPFAVLGLLSLLKLNPKIRNFVISWILAAPLPAALAYPAPHALRSLNILPIPQFLVALGIISFYLFISKKWKKIFLISLSVILIFSLGRYLYLYYHVFKTEKSSEWADGYKQAALKTFELEKDYEKVIVSGRYWQPYIYFLFYKKYDPALYQREGSKKKFDKYFFGGTLWDLGGKELWQLDLKKISDDKKSLLVFAPIDYAIKRNEIDVISKIYNHNNELVFYIGVLK